MAYLNPFNATLISGGTQAKQIDDTFRQMHAALIERLNDQVVVDATADPWALLDKVSGKKTGKTIIIPFNHFLTRGSGSTIINEGNVQTSGDAGPIQAGVVIPNGVTITKVGIYINASGVTNIKFYKVTGDVPFSVVELAAWQVTTAGQQLSESSTFSEVTDGKASYYMSVDMVSSSSLLSVIIYGGRVTYNAPGHQNTL